MYVCICSSLCLLHLFVCCVRLCVYASFIVTYIWQARNDPPFAVNTAGNNHISCASLCSPGNPNKQSISSSSSNITQCIIIIITSLPTMSGEDDSVASMRDGRSQVYVSDMKNHHTDARLGTRRNTETTNYSLKTMSTTDQTLEYYNVHRMNYSCWQAIADTLVVAPDSRYI